MHENIWRHMKSNKMTKKGRGNFKCTPLMGNLKFPLRFRFAAGFLLTQVQIFYQYAPFASFASISFASMTRCKIYMY